MSIRIRVLGEDGVNQWETIEKDFAKKLNKIASVSQQEAIIEELR